MKFYFDGCSYTYGGGLVENGYSLENRWSTLVCKHFGAEEYNFAEGGASNDCVLRHFFTGQVYEEKRSKVEDIRFDLNDFDFFFIQTTFPSRSEYFSDMKRRWQKMTVNRSSKPQYREKNLRLQEWLDYYYKELYSETQGKVKEIVAVKSIESHLKLLNKPYFLSTIIEDPVMTYDLEINKRNHKGKFLKYDRMSCEHPSRAGQRQIADDIIKKIKI